MKFLALILRVERGWLEASGKSIVLLIIRMKSLPRELASCRSNSDPLTVSHNADVMTSSVTSQLPAGEVNQTGKL